MKERVRLLGMEIGEMKMLNRMRLLENRLWR